VSLFNSVEGISRRLRLKCDGPRAETRFRLSAKRTSPFKSAPVGGGGRFSRLLAVEECESAGSDCILFSKYLGLQLENVATRREEAGNKGVVSVKLFITCKPTYLKGSCVDLRAGTDKAVLR
jgi:hypothetical protein